MQDKLFKKLKSRFTWTCVATSGAFLLVIFCAVFFIVYTNAQHQINSTVENALYDKIESVFQGRKDFIKLTILSDGTAISVGSDRYDTELAQEILKKAVEIQSGKFTAGRFQFFVDNVVARDLSGNQTAMIYVIYDATLIKDSLFTLGLTLTFSYAASIALITVIAILFSKAAVKPVEDAFIKQKMLVANASHELKTPLTIISTNLSVIESDKTKTVSENKKWLNNIDSCVSRMDCLVLDMLELSKLENAKLTKEVFNLSNLVEKSALSMDAACYEKKISLKTEIPSDVTMFSNPRQIVRLILILLDNAVKYTDAGGAINLKLAATNKKIILSVKNTGEGIPKDKTDKIFDRFYRLDSARTGDEKHSFGLGLAIAKAITDNLGAKISVESDEKSFTAFTVSFPN